MTEPILMKYLFYKMKPRKILSNKKRLIELYCIKFSTIYLDLTFIG